MRLPDLFDGIAKELRYRASQWPRVDEIENVSVTLQCDEPSLPVSWQL